MSTVQQTPLCKHTDTSFLSDIPPLGSPVHWAEFPVLPSRSSLVIYFMHSINLLTPLRDQVPSYMSMCPQSLQSWPTLCNPMDYILPDSSVHGILQARILEWVAVPSTRGSSPPRDQTHVSCIGGCVLYHWATWETPFPYTMMERATTINEENGAIDVLRRNLWTSLLISFCCS